MKTAAVLILIQGAAAGSSLRGLFSSKSLKFSGRSLEEAKSVSLTCSDICEDKVDSALATCLDDCVEPFQGGKGAEGRGMGSGSKKMTPVRVSACSSVRMTLKTSLYIFLSLSLQLARLF